MKLDTARVIVIAARRLGLKVKLYKDYSGRGMYGSRTAGVVGSMADITRAAALGAVLVSKKRGRVALDDYLADLRFRTDNMGFDMIVY